MRTEIIHFTADPKDHTISIEAGVSVDNSTTDILILEFGSGEATFSPGQHASLREDDVLTGVINSNTGQHLYSEVTANVNEPNNITITTELIRVTGWAVADFD